MRIILFVSLFLNAAIALACEPQEAQFIGKVKNFIEYRKNESNVVCSFQIEFYTYNISGTCPLEIGVVQNYVFQDMSCSKKNGDAVSGILVKTGPNVVIE